MARVRLLPAAVMLVALWLIVASPAAGVEICAQEDTVERKNCPAGFHWERMSGICCVQDRDTLPPNGKIGYVGDSLCIEGFVGVYESRPTTDGEGPPGCPGYTSFSFLTACLTPEEYAAYEAGQTGTTAASTPPAPTPTTPPTSAPAESDQGLGVAEAVAAAATPPDPGALALAGGITALTAGLLMAGVHVLGSPPVHFGSRAEAAAQAERSLQELERMQQAAEQVDAIDEEIDRLEDFDRRLRDALDRMLSEHDPRHWDLADLNEVVSGLLAIPAYAHPAAAFASALSSALSTVYNQWFSTDELEGATRDLAAELEFLRGRLHSDLADLRDRRVEALGSWQQAPSPPVDPESLSDAELRAAIDRAQDQVMETLDAGHRNESEVDRLRRKKDQLELDLLSLKSALDLAGEGYLGSVSDALPIESVAHSFLQNLQETGGYSALLAGSSKTAGQVAHALKAGSGVISSGASVAGFVAWLDQCAAEQQQEVIRMAIRSLSHDHGQLAAQFDRLTAAQTDLDQAHQAAVAERRRLSTAMDMRKASQGRLLGMGDE